MSPHFFSYPTVTELRPDQRETASDRAEGEPRPLGQRAEPGMGRADGEQTAAEDQAP